MRVLRGHNGPVVGAAYSPDGERIVTASFDQTARVWDAQSGEKEQVLRGHRAEVISAAFSPDGRSNVTGSTDRTATVWDAASGTRARVLYGHSAPVVSVAYSPDRRAILTASLDGTARIITCPTCDATLGELLALARQRVSRGLTRAERAQYLHEGG